MLTEKTLLMAKIESLATYGTDSEPDEDDDIVVVHNLSVTPNTTFNDTQGLDCSMSPRSGTIGRQYLDITFDHEIQTGSGATPTVLPCDALLKACGYKWAAGVYTPFSTYPAAASSATMYMYLDGMLWKTTGARGNVEFTFTAGEPAIASFTFQGLYVGGFTAAAFPTGCTTEASKPLVAINKALAWDGEAPEAESLSFSLNNTLFARPSLDDAATYGIAGIDITGRAGEGSMNPMASTTIGYLTAFNAGTVKALSYTLADVDASVAFELPKVQFTNLTPGDRSGTRIFDLPFKISRSLVAGDDELKITVTEV